jgi:NADH-quinone oxidoreductase subunit J
LDFGGRNKKMTLLFYLLATGAILSGFSVINSKNPIHSIFSLVVCIVNVSILLLILGAEFLALIFIIVYVGAIAILFLFVVMMLNIKLVELLDNATRYIPIGIIIGVIFFIEITIVQSGGFANDVLDYTSYSNICKITNIYALGELLYTEYSSYYIIASIIPLVALLAAILLTLSHDSTVKRQDLFTQVATDPNSTIRLSSK